MRQKVIILSTGGTIEKSYDKRQGSLSNRASLVKDWIVSRLRLPYVELEVREILNKDSQDLTLEDREKILAEIQGVQDHPTLVLHGTDTVDQTVDLVNDRLTQPRSAVVFTGAMIPMKFEDSDARQNFTEALMAARLLEPGVYLSFHNELFRPGRFRKNRDTATFERT